MSMAGLADQAAAERAGVGRGEEGAGGRGAVSVDDAYDGDSEMISEMDL